MGTPVVESQGGLSRWSVPVDGPSGMPGTIWYEVPSQYTDMLTYRCDPALIALTIPAMRLGLPLVFDGPITDELTFQYRDLQALYSASGDKPPVPVVFNRVVPAAPAGAGVAAGFSAGIDSYALLAEHHYAEDVPDALRLTHLLFNNVGSHADGREDLWRRRFARIAPVAERIGLPIIPVNSNLDEIPSPGVSYEPLNSPANASVAHLLGAGLRTWIFASSVEYRRVGVTHNSYNSAFVDPIALPLMSTESLALRVASSRMRRIDKTRLVAEIPDAWSSLDVCIQIEPLDKTNCARCWKCRLTLGALDLIGAVDRFDPQFDLDVWRADREAYLARVSLLKTPALVVELNELMAEVGYQPLPADRRRARQELAVEKAETFLRRVERRAGRLYREITRR
ncbi:hypothetical protein DY023_01850 [Microbacterium bovistercoris]|uniref:Uncharacterized protein n=1 Tax=Microbacterium bovistercoris TaxID=2293570 RepID=A0A371NXK6_9MICO|nr:hypothetical protein [Microbacterium bovistercoris]REJ08032.1 hypothetical protein DY023_01850 [Microbacterium bovistercoris]